MYQLLFLLISYYDKLSPLQPQQNENKRTHMREKNTINIRILLLLLIPTTVKLKHAKPR